MHLQKTPFAATPMKKKIKPLHAVLGCAGLSVLGVILAGFLGLQALYLVTGKPYFDTPPDRAKLRAIREPYRHIPAALEAHRVAHGTYPRTKADFDPAVPGGPDAAAILRGGKLYYSSDGAGYSIHLKLNWDGGLSYSSMRPHWVFGMQGDPDWPID
jgi:hypothetical protein